MKHLLFCRVRRRTSLLVRANTKRALQILEEYRCRATFFVLGWVAERDPALIREIIEAGHEVASHSYCHRRVNSFTPEEFREDLRRARAVIEDAAGVRILGYRAPMFSIGRDSLWALEILSEEGFLYDPSIFPIRHDLYEFPERRLSCKAPEQAQRIMPSTRGKVCARGLCQATTRTSRND